MRSVLIFGLGRVGARLACWALEADLDVAAVEPQPVPEIEELVEGGLRLLDRADGEEPDLVILATQDVRVEDLLRALDASQLAATPRVHCSGRLVATLRDGGGPLGRMHPLAAFPPLAGGGTIARPLFSLQGDHQALERAAGFLDRIGAPHIRVNALNAPLYHASCVLAANFLGGLGEVAERCMVAAGLERRDARSAVLSLMGSVLAGGRESGFLESLSGPVVRGDDQAVKAHEEALAEGMPEVTGLYRMGNSLLEFLLGRRDRP